MSLQSVDGGDGHEGPHLHTVPPQPPGGHIVTPDEPLCSRAELHSHAPHHAQILGVELSLVYTTWNKGFKMKIKKC